MDFGQQIKRVRNDHGLTQEEMANKLNVSRQTISSWENNRNLPDLELVVQIAEKFNLSVDELLTGENLKDKLVKDGKEVTKQRLNRNIYLIGAGLMVLGLILFLIKANSVEYVDAQGVLHENFYLIILGYFFILSGGIVILVNSLTIFGLEQGQKLIVLEEAVQ